MSIQATYDIMWASFQSAAASNDYELDQHLNNPANDSRRGISALAYLAQGSRSTINQIMHFQQQIQQIEPEQYFQPMDELHLTILPFISCIPNFGLEQINVDDYAEVFQSVLGQAKPIEIEYRGITASPSCIVIQGFPTDGALEGLRDGLRTQLHRAGLRASFDSRYKLVTAHSSIIRFRKPVTNSDRLVEICNHYREYSFGRLVLRDFELVFNNWYQNLWLTKTLAKAHCQ